MDDNQDLGKGAGEEAVDNNEEAIGSLEELTNERNALSDGANDAEDEVEDGSEEAVDGVEDVAEVDSERGDIITEGDDEASEGLLESGNEGSDFDDKVEEDLEIADSKSNIDTGNERKDGVDDNLNLSGEGDNLGLDLSNNVDGEVAGANKGGDGDQLLVDGGLEVGDGGQDRGDGAIKAVANIGNGRRSLGRDDRGISSEGESRSSEESGELHCVGSRYGEVDDIKSK